LREKLMLIFQTTFIKLRKKEKPRSSGNIFLHVMKKKTVIIALLHLKSPLREYKRGKISWICGIMSATTVLFVY